MGHTKKSFIWGPQHYTLGKIHEVGQDYLKDSCCYRVLWYQAFPRFSIVWGNRGRGGTSDSTPIGIVLGVSVFIYRETGSGSTGNGKKKRYNTQQDLTVCYSVLWDFTTKVFFFQLTQKHVGVLMPSCICAVAFSKDFVKLAKLGTC